MHEPLDHGLAFLVAQDSLAHESHDDFVHDVGWRISSHLRHRAETIFRRRFIFGRGAAELADPFLKQLDLFGFDGRKLKPHSHAAGGVGDLRLRQKSRFVLHAAHFHQITQREGVHHLAQGAGHLC